MRVKTHILLFRGINVGGKNKIPMVDLRAMLSELGFSDVRTYIQSGNALVRSEHPADEVRQMVEQAMRSSFELDVTLVKVLVLSPEQLAAVVDDRPAGFGDEPDRFHSDVIFLIDIAPEEALAVFDPREGVDFVIAGDSVIYSARLSEQRTKSRLSKIVGTKVYQSMTIRNWNTVTKLLAMSRESE